MKHEDCERKTTEWAPGLWSGGAKGEKLHEKYGRKRRDVLLGLASRFSPFMNFRFSFLLLLGFAACTVPRKSAPQYAALDTLSVKAKPPLPGRYNPEATRVWDILHTELHLSFDWKERTAGGFAVLHMAPYAFGQDSILLDAKSMDIRSVRYAGGATIGPSLRFKHTGDTLRIFLPETVAPGRQQNIEIIYTAKPYASVAKGSTAIREARGLYFINTDYAIPGKPAQIWTQGETESNSHWFPTIDKPNERFTTDISITVPDSFTTLSNGTMVSSTRNGGGRTDRWKMDLPIQPYAVMMAIGKYSIVEDEKWRGRPVNYYVEPEYAPYAKRIFQHTPEMMEYFSSVTGVPYPWPKYSQVVVRDFVSGAMENTSASTFGEFMNRNNRELLDGNGEDVVSHELFHQWFGDYATAESWANLTVNESFATYGEVLWRRYKYGDDKAEELRQDDLNRYLASTERRDPSLVRFYYENKEDMFDRVSYQKGGCILHYMHRIMGDSAFSRSMKIYLTKNALQPAEAHDWRQAVEEATGEDWNPFFNQWYFRGGHPQLEVTHDYNDSLGQLRVVVAQVQRDSSFHYNLPMQMAIIRGGRNVERTNWTLVKRRDTFTVAYQNATRPVVLADAGHWVVGEISDKRPGELETQWATLYTALPDYITRRNALSAMRGKEGSATATPVISAALASSNASLRTRALNMLSGAKDSLVRERYADAVLRIARADSSSGTRAAAFSTLAAWRIFSMLPVASAAVNDSSYVVAGTALLAIDKMEESGKKGSTAYGEAIRLLPTAERGELWHAALTVIAGYGKPADTAVFFRQLRSGHESGKVSVASKLARFASSTSDTAAFAASLRMIDRLARDEKDAGDRRSYITALYQMHGALNTPVGNTRDLSRVAIAERMRRVRETLEVLTARETGADLREFLQNTYKINFPKTAPVKK
jgi:aminopeptidase N